MGGGPGFANAANNRTLTPTQTSLEPSIKQLHNAESIVQAGSGRVHGQQVSRFTVTFAPGGYPQNDLPFAELLEKECPEPVQVDLAIAPSGLPVRVSVSATYPISRQSTTSTTQILASNFHFSALKPPPARKTISAAALRRFQSAQLRKELEKYKKHHRRERGKKPH